MGKEKSPAGSGKPHGTKDGAPFKRHYHPAGTSGIIPPAG